MTPLFDSFVLRWPTQSCASVLSSSSIYHWLTSNVCKSDTSGSRLKVPFAVTRHMCALMQWCWLSQTGIKLRGTTPQLKYVLSAISNYINTVLKYNIIWIQIVRETQEGISFLGSPNVYCVIDQLQRSWAHCALQILKSAIFGEYFVCVSSSVSLPFLAQFTHTKCHIKGKGFGDKMYIYIYISELFTFVEYLNQAGFKTCQVSFCTKCSLCTMFLLYLIETKQSW